MNEFTLIETWFQSLLHSRTDVCVGIGDDAACLAVPPGHQLLVSCDTLVAGVHFRDTWSAYDIAYRTVMVNLSDIAAMGGSPAWVTLALTLPVFNHAWLNDFSRGLQAAISQYNIALVGGDTTRGPLCVTLTVHGFIPDGKAVKRNGAKAGDKIYLTGALGAAAEALLWLDKGGLPKDHHALLMKALLHPQPRLDWAEALRQFASAAIDISDGLEADLNHICNQSNVGALLFLDRIPVHPLVSLYQREGALFLAMQGGDDYELCVTVPAIKETAFLTYLAEHGLSAYCIGMIEAVPGLRGQYNGKEVISLQGKGYCHF